MMLNYLFVAFVLAIGVCDCAKFPPEIPQCNFDDTTCIKDTTNLVLKNLHGGFPGINLAAVDPLVINKIQLKQGADSPVNIELNFNDVQLTGLKDHTCFFVKGFHENPEGKYEFRLRGPELVLSGPYSIKGRILILPITGTGYSNFTLVNPELHIKYTGKSRRKHGKTHLYTDDLKLSFKISRMYAHLSNLYNGDKALGDSTNQFLNENWQDIFKEIKGSIFGAFSLIMQTMLNNMWAHHDYKDLFLPKNSVHV